MVPTAAQLHGTPRFPRRNAAFSASVHARIRDSPRIGTIALRRSLQQARRVHTAAKAVSKFSSWGCSSQKRFAGTRAEFFDRCSV